MNIPDVSQLDWSQMLTWVSSFAAVMAAVGAISSAIISRKIYLSQTRPNVIVYIEHDRSKGTIVLWIKNIGNGVAFDLSFDLEGLPGLDRVDRGFVKKLNIDGIKMLAPGSAVNSLVGVASDSVFRDPVGIIPVQVSYYGSKEKKGPRLCDDYFLDYDAIIGSTYADSEEHQTRKAVEAISKEINESAKVIKTAIVSIKQK